MWYIQTVNLQEILEKILVSPNKWSMLDGSTAPPVTSLTIRASRNHMFSHEVSFSGHVLNDEIVEDAATPIQTGEHIKRLQWQKNCTETKIRKLKSLNPEYNQDISFITSCTNTNSQESNTLVQVSTEKYKTFLLLQKPNSLLHHLFKIPQLDTTF
jgi:hypothetical protein